MNWLQPALGFALIMLVLATVVTVILETGYRLLLTREKGFRLMMERIFDEVLKPRVAHLLHDVTVPQARERFLNAVTRNQAYEEKLSPVRALIQRNELSSMTMMQLADRLADTDVGRAISRGGSQYVQNAINDLAQKFDRFGAAASQRFQDHARFWCVLTSFLLVFVANIDAVRVFQALTRDEQLTNAIITRYGDRVNETAPAPRDTLESLKAIDASQAQGVVTEADLQTLQRDIGNARTQVVELRDTGLPITAAYFPFCTGIVENKAMDENCDKPTTNLASWQGVNEVRHRVFSAAGLLWFLSVLLAGALVGLGAPFWFNLARGLTRGAQLLGVGSREETPAAAAAPVVGGPSPPPRTPVEAFEVAIAAAPPPRARILLSPTGRPVRGV